MLKSANTRVRRDKATGRLRVVRLEERIAPAPGAPSDPCRSMRDRAVVSRKGAPCLPP